MQPRDFTALLDRLFSALHICDRHGLVAPAVKLVEAIETLRSHELADPMAFAAFDATEEDREGRK